MSAACPQLCLRPGKRDELRRALEYQIFRPPQIAVSDQALTNQRDWDWPIRPVAAPCEEIVRDQQRFKYTSRGNLVAVITTARRARLGNMALGGKAWDEGKGVLFRSLRH